MIKSFTMLALVCPAGCRTMITWESCETLQTCLERPKDFGTWINDVLTRSYERAFEGVLNDWIFAMGEDYCLCAEGRPCLELACSWCRRLNSGERCPSERAALVTPLHWPEDDPPARRRLGPGMRGRRGGPGVPPN